MTTTRIPHDGGACPVSPGTDFYWLEKFADFMMFITIFLGGVFLGVHIR